MPDDFVDQSGGTGKEEEDQDRGLKTTWVSHWYRCYEVIDPFVIGGRKAMASLPPIKQDSLLP